LKKLLLAAALTFITLQAFSLEKVTDLKELVQRVSTTNKLVVVIFTKDKETASTKLEGIVKSYETANTDSDVVFLQAPTEVSEIKTFATKSLKAKEFPLSVFSIDGAVIAGIIGTPADLTEFSAVIKTVTDAVKQLRAKEAQQKKDVI
jgi:hypothetical protein